MIGDERDILPNNSKSSSKELIPSSSSAAAYLKNNPGNSLPAISTASQVARRTLNLYNIHATNVGALTTNIGLGLKKSNSGHKLNSKFSRGKLHAQIKDKRPLLGRTCIYKCV